MKIFDTNTEYSSYNIHHLRIINVLSSNSILKNYDFENLMRLAIGIYTIWENNNEIVKFYPNLLISNQAEYAYIADFINAKLGEIIKVYENETRK